MKQASARRISGKEDLKRQFFFWPTRNCQFLTTFGHGLNADTSAKQRINPSRRDSSKNSREENAQGKTKGRISGDKKRQAHAREKEPHARTISLFV